MSDSGDGGDPPRSNGHFTGVAREGLNHLNLNLGPNMNMNSSFPTNIRIEESSQGSPEPFAYDPLQRRIFDYDQVGPPTQKIVHRVLCGHHRVDGEDHQDHPAQADFLDVPQLFTNDTRGSALRGQKPLINPQEYWDEHPEICAVITREYSCESYHRNLKDSFQVITTGIDRHVFNRLRPWFFRLPDNGPSAISTSESIMISQALSTSLMSLTFRNELGEWNQERNLKAPYDYFYHFRHDLRRHAELQLGSPDKQELDVLLDYIDMTQGDKFDKVDGMFNSGLVHRDIFSKLFRPNDLIVTIQEGQPRAYIAEKAFPSERRTPLERQSVSLECWTWEFDGGFRKKTAQLSVSWPTANPTTVAVDGLTAWPLRLDKSTMRERLLKRGKNVWMCRKRKLMSYSSPTPTIFELQVTNPKYMIDYSTYRQMHSNKYPQAMATDAEMLEQGIDMASEEPPSETFCILLPASMLGYAFHDKKWRSLSMEHVEPVPWNKKAFDRLVLKPSKKATIKALVTVHLTTVQNVDVVENKGNGLIILLHGSPGTGKTLTAESVAEIAEKPLYRVTCGDIGTDAESVEKYMESVLLIGTIWECVVLLDEADVFLEERQVTDLARNALVSVFLRVLEYYDGILILTTNRVGTFDEAFKSRIQLAIHYPPLNEKGRYEIWLNFIRILREKEVDMNYDELEDKARLLADTPFNGRQIRNNLWTAAQVAKYNRERLEYKHLEQVVEISEEFEKYLLQTHGGVTDEVNASMHRLRSS